MDLPAVVRSTHTWDTAPGSDLHGGEEAIVVSVTQAYDGMGCRWDWSLIPLDRPRLIRISTRVVPEVALRRWLRPV